MTNRHLASIIETSTKEKDMPTYKELRAIDNDAYFSAGESPIGQQSAMIDGRTYSVQYKLVNRKCFDNMQTPTASYKINGARVARAKFYSQADADTKNQ